MGPPTSRSPAAPEAAAGPNSPHDDIWTFDDVFTSEYAAIHSRQPTLKGGPPASQMPTVDNGLTGIACSGGGIRSASFCLGALQALNAAGAIPNISYLSTVSGGGYIGTAMTVGMSTNGGLFPFGKTGEDIGETPETRHLRDNSRYLLQNGVQSAISAVAIYLRGIVMNIIIVLPFLFALAGLLVLAGPDTRRLSASWQWMSGFPEAIKNAAMPLSAIGAMVVAALLVVYAVGVSVSPIIALEKRRKIAIAAAVVMCIFAAAILLDLHLWLLRTAFHVQEVRTQPSAEQPPLQIADSFLQTFKKLVAVATPIVVAILPFIKTLVQKAGSDKSSGASGALSRWTSRLVLIAIAAVVPAALWLTVLQLAYWGIGVTVCPGGGHLAECATTATDTWQHAPGWLQSIFAYGEPVPVVQIERQVGWGFIVAGAALLVFWPFLNVNSNSLHQLYRDRLGSAFLVKRKVPGSDEFEPADNFSLTDISATQAPYHLINTALNVPGSTFANQRGRNADFFLFSRNFVGSQATGYVPTAMAEHVTDGLNIGTAMAISGAAAAPNMGMASVRPLSPTIAFLNVRLGRWLRHPMSIAKLADTGGISRWWHGKPGPLYLLREAFSKSGATIVDPKTEEPLSTGFVFLTDGGHIENLGIYELLRRRCAVVVAVDGEADAEMTGSSLVQLERFARIDLGVRISMDWKPISERSRTVSENVVKRINSPAPGPHVALGLIDYPPGPGGKREEGVLVYIKASLSGDENDYIMAYKSAHPDFPHESTMDQLFTEEQFEAYRALGEHIARRFLRGEDKASPGDPGRAALLARVKDHFPSINPA